MPIDNDLERTGVRSTWMIDMSIEVDTDELLREGPEPFATRVRALLEEKMKVILQIPWRQVAQQLRPEPEIELQSSSQTTTDTARPSDAPSPQSPNTPQASE